MGQKFSMSNVYHDLHLMAPERGDKWHENAINVMNQTSGFWSEKQIP